MKNVGKNIRFALAAAIAAAATTTSLSPALAQDKKLNIGLALYTQLQPRWLFDAKAFEEQAAKNGDKVIVQYADGDPNKQTQQVQSMMARGIDVLVIASADIAVGSTLIENAKKDGVKTIAYDIGVKTGAPDWMIVRNQEQVATLQVEAALKDKPQGNYAVLKGDAANDLAQTSSEVYERLLKDKPGIKVVYNDFVKAFDPATANRVAEDVLTRNRDDIVAFLGNNDGIATGIVQALKGSDLTGKVFVSGLDADQANLHLIATGAQTMTVYTPIDEMARQAADAAHQLGNGQEPPHDKVIDNTKGKVPLKQVGLIAVNKDNLCEFLTKTAPKGWADPDAVLKGTDVKCQ